MMGLKKQGLYLPEFEHDNCGAGFICSLKGIKSNDIIHKALEILDKLEHRGAVSSDGKTGDGAGILIDIPHAFFKDACSFELPEAGEYAVGNVFLPQKENQRNFCIQVFEENIKKQGLAPRAREPFRSGKNSGRNRTVCNASFCRKRRGFGRIPI